MHISITRRSALALGVAAALALAGCGDKPAQQAAQTAAKAPAAELIPVGIIQLVEHNALDAATRGIVDALAERGFKDGVNIRLDIQNAQGDQSNLHNIANRFVSNKDKIIFAVATPAAQAVATVAKDTPIVATAITDFVAGKLVKSDAAPGGNVTGVSDLGPIAAQFDLLMKLVPNAKNVGTIYNSSEINSAYQVDILKKAAAEKGVNVLEATVSNVNDIQQAVASLKGKVDALYLPTDNVIASAVPALAKVVNPAGIPAIAGEMGMVGAGCLGSISVDYYELGKMTGRMGADVLEGKAKPATTPVQHVTSGTPVFNMKTAKAIGLEIPEDLKKGAKLFE